MLKEEIGKLLGKPELRKISDALKKRQFPHRKNIQYYWCVNVFMSGNEETIFLSNDRKTWEINL